jgi:Protein of unknown function (DUF3102)
MTTVNAQDAAPPEALAASNSLTDLAARILAEHTAIHGLLSESIERAMAAGDLLIEAKALVKHGQWLPWLADHCKISERTAQLYMRVARNRAEIEATKSATNADLNLSEAAALLMLSSDVRKLLMFVKECEGLEGEELVQACLDAGVAVFTSPKPVRGPVRQRAAGVEAVQPMAHPAGPQPRLGAVSCRVVDAHRR